MRTDWYRTLSLLAGVDPEDDWLDPATNITHGIDGVDIWPSLMSPNGKLRPAREYLPTTERSLIFDDAKVRIHIIRNARMEM